MLKNNIKLSTEFAHPLGGGALFSLINLGFCFDKWHNTALFDLLSNTYVRPVHGVSAKNLTPYLVRFFFAKNLYKQQNENLSQVLNNKYIKALKKSQNNYKLNTQLIT